MLQYSLPALKTSMLFLGVHIGICQFLPETFKCETTIILFLQSYVEHGYSFHDTAISKYGIWCFPNAVVEMSITCDKRNKIFVWSINNNNIIFTITVHPMELYLFTFLFIQPKAMLSIPNSIRIPKMFLLGDVKKKWTLYHISNSHNHSVMPLNCHCTDSPS